MLIKYPTLQLDFLDERSDDKGGNTDAAEGTMILLMTHP